MFGKEITEDDQRDDLCIKSFRNDYAIVYNQIITKSFDD